MKTTRILAAMIAAAVGIGATGPAFCQQERDVIEVLRAQVQTNRQALVAENLNLSAEESDVFWPLYREFHAERAELIDRRIQLLTDFRDNFDMLSDEKAKELLDNYFDLRKDTTKLQEKYAKKFRKVLSDKKTLRYFQIENKMDTIIDYGLVQVTPLAE